MTLLKHVARVRVSNVDKKTRDGEQAVRLCNYTDVYYGDVLSARADGYMLATASLEQVRDFALRAGDTLLTKDSETAEDIGVSAYIADGADDFVCGYHLAIIRPDAARVDPRYLSWCLRSSAVRGVLASSATGVTRYGLRTEALTNLDLVLPDRDDQASRAAFLDEQVPLLDATVAARRKQAVLLIERQASLIDETVDQLRSALPERPVKYLVTEVDERLGACNEAPTLLSVSIHLGVIPRSQLTSKEPRAEDLAVYKRCRAGDIVLNRMRAFQGGVGVAREDGVVSPDYAVLRPLPGVSSDWLHLLFRSRWFVSEMTSRLRGLGGVEQGAVRTPRINVADLGLITVPDLPGPEQERYAAALAGEHSWRSTLGDLGVRQAALIEERKTAVIDAVVMGVLDPRTARSVA